MSRPFRYTFILILVALGTGLAAVGGWRYARASAPVNGPIIVISIDALRPDHLPVYGYRGVPTPAIDALAADGVVFDRAYSHVPQTLPAHVSLLTGRLPFETGVRDDVGFALPKAERTVAEMLRDRGFETGAVVSSYALREETGLARGFAFFDGHMPAAPPEDMPGALERDGTESERIAERWLDGAGTSRVFLFLQLNEPHAPYRPPARFAGHTPYDGEIAYADEILGHFVRYLKTHQLYDRSTIVLVSDHGEGLGDHGEIEHGLFIYEEAIRVPLIVKQAAGEGAGRRVREVVQHIDLVPTILDLAKAPVPGNLRGRSLEPLLGGSGTLGARTVYAESLYGRYHFGWGELTSAGDGQHRYIRAPREELYDLQTDPKEQKNILESGAAGGESLRLALDRLNAIARIQPPGDVPAAERERLGAQGSVGADPALAADRGADLPDPKDHLEIVEQLRAASRLSADRNWNEAIEVLRTVSRANPTLAGVWTDLAILNGRADRHRDAVEAWARVIELRPDDPNGYLGSAATLLHLRKLDDARLHAEQAARLSERDPRSRASAHELLARIALARHDADAARVEADLAAKADPTLPLAAYVDARLLYDQGRYADALPLFQQAVAELEKAKGRPLTDLHFQTADALARLDRYAEAESEFLEELTAFPLNARARAGLATLYHATGRTDEAASALADLVRITPTPDAYAIAARTWTAFGNRREAQAVRREATRLFASPPPATQH